MRLILADFDQDTLMPISQERADRRAAIAAEMRRVAKASEAHLPIDQRRQVMLVQSEQVEHTAEWDRWDWIAYALPWAALGFGILGPIAYVCLRIFV